MGRLAQLLHRVGKVDVVELRRLLEPLEVVAVAEDRRAAIGLVGANPLEHTGAVMEAVGEDVDLGVVPRDQLAIHPDPLRLLHGSSKKGDHSTWPPVAQVRQVCRNTRPPPTGAQAARASITASAISSVPTSICSGNPGAAGLVVPSLARSGVRSPPSRAESTARSIAL